MKAIKLVLIIFVFCLIAGTTLAADLVPPCGDTGQPACATGDFFVLVRNVINYFVFALAVPAATIAIAYAGISMASHPADESKRTQAKEILWAAVIGLALVLGAWLIMKTLFVYLVKPEARQQIRTSTGVDFGD